MTQKKKKKDPAIVLISIDSLRADCFGAPQMPHWPHDYPSCRAPQAKILKALAARGTLFRNTITAAPYTSASHGAYLTGLWPPRNGLREVFKNALTAPDVFARLKTEGFRTCLKTDFPMILGDALGFTKYVDETLVEDDLGFLDNISSAGPVLGLCHFSGAHFPYGFHTLALSGDAYSEKVESLETSLSLNLDETPDRIDETWRYGDDRSLLIRYKRIIQYLYRKEDYSKLFALYLEGLDVFLETRLVPFITKLDRSLAGRDSLIVIFGDHGEHWSPDSYGHHNSMREGVLRVPMLFIRRGVGMDREVAARVRSVDLVPTVLD